MIGIVCPSDFEYEVLKHDRFSTREARLVKSGMGKLRAFEACCRLKEKGALGAVLLIGFAGGLTPDLKIGDVIEPNIFIEQDFFAEPFEKFPHEIKNRNRKLLLESKDCTMLTQDRFLTENPYADSRLRGNDKEKGEYKTIACDMESYAVAYFCQGAGVPYSVVKLISDTADHTAAHDFLKACRELSPKLNETVKKAVQKIKDFHAC